jgi:hypothetical protein
LPIIYFAFRNRLCASNENAPVAVLPPAIGVMRLRDITKAQALAFHLFGNRGTVKELAIRGHGQPALPE